MGKSSLGTGFDALMGRNAGLVGQVSAGLANAGQNAASGEGVSRIPLALVDPNPFQPRVEFGEDEILELAESIRKQGLLQPITVRKHQDRYQIIAGERRVRACRLLGDETIAALVKEKISDRRMAALGLVENIQRVDLNPVEEAVAMRQLQEQYDYTHEQLAEELGRSRSAVTNGLRLLSLPEEVLDLLREKKLTAGHARALLSDGLADPAALAREIVAKGLSVRQAEELSRKSGKTKTKKAKKPESWWSTSTASAPSRSASPRTSSSRRSTPGSRASSEGGAVRACASSPRFRSSPRERGRCGRSTSTAGSSG